MNTETLDRIISMYQDGTDSVAIGKELAICDSHVRHLLRSRGLMRSRGLAKRTNTLNDNAFDTLADESVYWLGFLFADGHLRCSASGHYRLCLEVQESDVAHVEALRTFLGSTHTVQRNKRGGIQYQVSSTHMGHTLSDLGMMKPKLQRVPPVGCEMNPHYWRGAIDADGWVYGRGKAYRRDTLGFCGSRENVEAFRAFVLSHAPNFAGTVRPSHGIRKTPIYRVETVCRTARAIAHVLYEDATVALQRKCEEARRMLLND